MMHMRKVFKFIMLFALAISGLSTPGFSDSDISSVKKSEIIQNIRGVNIPFIANNGQTDEQVKFYANTFGGTVFVTNDGAIVYSLPKALGVESSESRVESLDCRDELRASELIHSAGCGIHDNHKSCINARLGEAERTQQNKNKAVIDGFTSYVRQSQDRFNPSCTTDITEASPAPVEGKECFKQISDLHFPTPKSQSPTTNISSRGVVLRERLVGASTGKIIGEQPAVTKVNYFRGNDPSKWKDNIATYETVNIGEVYKGIELKLRAYGDNVEKLFYVKPGANPGQIKMSLSGLKPHESQGKFERLFDGFTSLNPSCINPAIGNQACRLGEAKRTQQNNVAKGTSRLWVNEQGQLVAETGLGPVKFTKPVAYQEIDGKRVEVDVEYTIENTKDSSQNIMNHESVNPKSPIFSLQPLIPNSHSPDFKSQTPDSQSLVYGFKVAAYDKSHDLIIDPLLASTFLGGSDSDYVGGVEYYGNTIAIDRSNNVYVTGYTDSDDFPTTSGAYDTTWDGGTYDVFISKLDSSLSNLLASTYLGGSGVDYGNAIATDSSDNVYVTGYTNSDDFPTTSGAYDTSIGESYNGTNVFISKLDSSLSSLLASTYLGGESMNEGYAMAIDSSGNIYVTGCTYSSDFPTTSGAYDTTGNSSIDRRDRDVFISKLNSTLSSLLASTYLGGTSIDYGFAIAIDSSDNVYVTGFTTYYTTGVGFPKNFPTTSGAYDTSSNSEYSDVFISKLNSTLSSLLASTYLGGSSSETGYAIAIDSSDNVYVTGYTNSDDFPTTSGAYDDTSDSNSGYYDVFISKLNSSLSSLLASTYLGGSSSETGYGIAIDSSDNVYVTGETGSNDFPTTSGAYDTTFKKGFSYDVFISKLDSTLSSLLASTYLGGYDFDRGGAIVIDSSNSVYVMGQTYSSDFPTTNGAYDVYYRNRDDDPLDVFVSKLDSNLSSSDTTVNEICEVADIWVGTSEESRESLSIKRKKKESVYVTVVGDTLCAVKGEKITATVNNSGKKLVKIKPSNAETDRDGIATFKLKAKSKTGSTTITFSTESGLSATMEVTVY